MPGVSRRFVVGVLGTGVMASPLVARALGTADARADGASSGPGETSGTDVARARALLHPLAEGSRLARWNVVAIHGLEHGAVGVDVSGDDGHVFRLEILARDRSPMSPTAPGQTERFAVFVRNGGDGWLPTEEEQGLAAMTLATVLGANAQTADGFLTYAERLEQHRGSLLPAK